VAVRSLILMHVDSRHPGMGVAEMRPRPMREKERKRRGWCKKNFMVADEGVGKVWRGDGRLCPEWWFDRLGNAEGVGGGDEEDVCSG